MGSIIRTAKPVLVILLIVSLYGCGGGARHLDAAAPKLPTPAVGVPRDDGLVVLPPPGPPSPDSPDPEPGNEDVLPPIPESIVYDPLWEEPPNGYLTSVEIDPETGQSVTHTYANDELLVVFAAKATIEEIDQALGRIGAWKQLWDRWIDFWVIGFEPVAGIPELEAKITKLSAEPIVVSVTGSEVCFWTFAATIPLDRPGKSVAAPAHR
jgi:hypothetical protein